MEHRLLKLTRNRPEFFSGHGEKTAENAGDTGMKGLFGSHIHITAKVLDLRLERQNVVTGNIANQNTPNYRPRRLEFEEKMQDALALDQRGKMTRTQESHLPAAFDANSFEGNNWKEFHAKQVYGEDSVDIDKEMSTMAKNSMMYNALSQVIKKNFTGMEKVITKGSM